MRTILTVFRKEILDTMRDRRTIIVMVVLPMLLFPVLFKVMYTVQKSSADKEKARELRVACFNDGNAARFVEMLRESDNMKLVEAPRDSVRSMVARGDLDAGFIFDADFDRKVADMKPAKITVLYKSTDDTGIARRRLSRLVDTYEEGLRAARFQKLQLDESVVDVVDLKLTNVATVEEQFGKQVGGFLPYIFILFCFMGSMYPALDLGAGEKERGTLETLLTAPVSRFQILIGKFLVVVTTGLASAAVSMLGLFVGIRTQGDLPPEFMDIVVKLLGWDTIVLVLSLLIPLTVFFAGILLSVSLTAKTFKEAQSMVTPLNIAVILPAAIGMVPGLELTYRTALIPVLNITLATKDIIAGTVSIPHLAVVYASLIALALLSLYGASAWFRRESTIFRT